MNTTYGLRSVHKSGLVQEVVDVRDIELLEQHLRLGGPPGARELHQTLCLEVLQLLQLSFCEALQVRQIPCRACVLYLGSNVGKVQPSQVSQAGASHKGAHALIMVHTLPHAIEDLWLPTPSATARQASSDGSHTYVIDVVLPQPVVDHNTQTRTTFSTTSWGKS